MSSSLMILFYIDILIVSFMFYYIYNVSLIYDLFLYSRFLSQQPYPAYPRFPWMQDMGFL